MRKIVICITDDYSNLTYLGEYLVIDESRTEYYIIDDCNIYISVEKFLFKEK